MIKDIRLIIKRITDINQLLLLSTLLSVGMVVARILYSWELTYLFLVWNLFLAWIPYIISYQLCSGNKVWKKDFHLILWAGLWLLFYPNAFYILTDLFHLAEHKGAPKWFDLILILSFAWNGLILGVLSLFDMQILAEKRKGKQFGTGFLVTVIILTGFGVYLGRYERWNSWDLFINTTGLLADIFYLIVHPVRNMRVYGFTLFFSMFQGIFYFMFLYFLRSRRSNRLDNKELNRAGSILKATKIE